MSNVDSSKSLTSTGAFAPTNLNSFTSDPIAGIYPRTAAVQPYVFVRVPNARPSTIGVPDRRLSQLLMNVTDENRHDEIDFGSPVGNEEW